MVTDGGDARRWLFPAVAMLLAMTCGLLAGCQATPREPEWQLVKDKKEIRSYSRQREGQEHPDLRGECRVAASVEDVFAEFDDIASYGEWMPSCRESQVLEASASRTETRQVYLRMRAPFMLRAFVKDRDVVLELRSVPADDGALALEFHAIESSFEKKPNVIRTPRFDGRIELSPLEPEGTLVVYEIQVDLGGDVFEPLRDYVTRELPYRVLRALHARVVDED